MSLTTHLKNPSSPINSFFHDTFPHSRQFFRSLRRSIELSTKILPEGDIENYPYYLIGMAIGYRIEFFFETRPFEEIRSAHLGARWACGIGRNGGYDFDL